MTDEHNTWEPSQNVSNAAEFVQDYWLTQPANCRLAAWLSLIACWYLGILLFYSSSRVA